jgi:colicin import membrane protein
MAARQTLRAIGLSLAVHGVMALFLVLGTLNWQPFDHTPPPVQVRLVDSSPILDQRRAEEQARQQAEDQARREAEQARRRAEEQARQEAEQARRQAEQQARREAEAEAQRQREIEARRQAQEQARREAEQARRAEEAAREAELAEIRRQREAAEARRREEEQRLAELSARREAEEQARREAEEAERLRLSDQQAAADARRATLSEEYILTIQTLVRRNWTRPPTTQPGTACTVKVFQIPGGEIIAAEVVRPCNADAATQRSIIAAVNRVGELPYRGYERVFQREIEFLFRYDG